MSASAQQPSALDAETQEALGICGGDALAALRITLIANAFLESELDQHKDEIAGLEIEIARLKAQISPGFTRAKRA